jgi:hypothetical protein
MFRRIFMLIALALPASQAASRPSMDCSIGPLEATFGGTAWQVYGCSDGASVVIVTAQDNPAAPFYFMIFPQGEALRLYGEGTGRRELTQAAYDELAARLSPEFAASLHASASRAATPDADGERPDR